MKKFLKIILVSCPVFLVIACNSKEQKPQDTVKRNELKPAASIKQVKITKVEETELFDPLEAYADYFVVVVDTGSNYQNLHHKMLDLSKKYKLNIDTLGRFYDHEKDLIMLPKDDEDEIYAGDYFPRRAVDETVSIEYLAVYQPKSKVKTMALIAGIYEDEMSATSRFSKIKEDFPNAFKIKSHLYVGCMH